MISFRKLLRQVLLERTSFKRLLAGSESGRKQRGRTDVNVKPMRVTTMDENEAWTFSYKSSPSTTGNRWHGYVQFFKEDVSHKDSAEDLECMVDCDCPDYRYRYAYNNAQDGVGRIGKHPEWPHGNQNNGQKWKPRSQGGVGDYGVGLCKHLCALSEYLKTKMEPDAPEPDEPEDMKAQPKPKPTPPPVKPSPVTKPQTTTAPDPDDDTYTDSRTGSDTLQEGRSPIYERLNQFVIENREFEVPYEDD